MLDGQHLRSKDVILKMVGLRKAINASIELVEPDGFWFVGEDFVKELSKDGLNVGMKTPVVYVPNAQIEYLIGSQESRVRESVYEVSYGLGIICPKHPPGIGVDTKWSAAYSISSVLGLQLKAVFNLCFTGISVPGGYMSARRKAALALCFAIFIGGLLLDGSAAGSRTPTGTVSNPVPTIASLSPWVVFTGAAAQTLTIKGTNFLASSTVTYNGTPHAATFVSPTSLTISLTATDLAKAGTYPVVVANPSPGGGSSAAMNFTVVDDEALLRGENELLTVSLFK
jgi:hypothetical protein